MKNVGANKVKGGNKMSSMKKYRDYVFMLREKYKGSICLENMTNEEIETFCNLFVEMRKEQLETKEERKCI